MTNENSIILADVFGRTPALIALAQSIGAIKIIDPYQGRMMGFTDEAQAYQYFVDKVGIDAYLDSVSYELSELSKPSTMIGFSVGASVLWRLSQSYQGKYIKRAIGFYGSQIRHDLHITPMFAVQLILPKFEPHFAIEQLAQVVESKPLVSVLKTDYLHGFMNKCSVNFDELGYQEHIKQLKKTLNLDEQ